MTRQGFIVYIYVYILGVVTGPDLRMEGFTYLAAADDQHILGLDLPGEDEAASALDLWELVLFCAHAGIVLLVCRGAR